jgi:phosphoglycolate phosphatase-like HAD superfamily hydrolase
MAKSLSEYIAWLDERPQLKWPAPPECVPVDATPSIRPIEGVRGVSWSLYGTLLRVHGGRLFHVHPQSLRMEIALQKTIEEFNMWNSMSRKPGQPWEYMLQQYEKVVEEMGMAATKRKGDATEVDSSRVWFKLIDRLLRNEYEYDRDLYGDHEALAGKVAFFFHSMLQGAGLFPNAAETLQRLSGAGIRQGLLDDAQAFSLKQLHRALQSAEPPLTLSGAISPECTALSYQFGIRKPSSTLYAIAVEQYNRIGIEPQEVLYVSNRLRDDLAIARQHGFRTALFVGDDRSCDVDPAELRDPATRPDRLITDLAQVPAIVGA